MDVWRQAVVHLRVQVGGRHTAASVNNCLCFGMSGSGGSQIGKRCLIAAQVEVIPNSLFKNGNRI